MTHWNPKCECKMTVKIKTASNVGFKDPAANGVMVKGINPIDSTLSNVQ